MLTRNISTPSLVDTASQIVVSIFVCLASMRVLTKCEPFIKDRVDLFSEMSQWQTFFVMFAALLIKYVSPEMKESNGEKAW